MITGKGVAALIVLFGCLVVLPAIAEKLDKTGNPGHSKTRVSSLGFIELEVPVARAIEVLVKENPWSSGFHGALNQRWTIVFRGKISNRAVEAAKAAGLEVTYREAPAGSGQILTDISLPGVGMAEIEKATKVFNEFAELYESSSNPRVLRAKPKPLSVKI
jgi:hypothetical protein